MLKKMNPAENEIDTSKKSGLNKSYLTSKIPPDRYPLLRRGSLLISAGTMIAIVETFIAMYLDLHHVTYKQAVIIAIFLLLMTSILIMITYLKKNLLVWHEWAVFGTYVLLFQVGYCLWIYRLGELRFLALINALTSITILLSYTNIVQSFLISIVSLICYFTVSWYSIMVAGQSGSLEKEAFFSFCLIPSFLLISLASNYITKNRKNLQKAKSDLEKLNYEISNANIKLKKEQFLSKIEMSLAREIQNAIFPGKAPITSDWDVAFMSKAFGDVSGDFYDFYCKENSLQGISLFDVSGHGVAPALITILAKPVLYSHFNRNDLSGLDEVLESANADLLDELEAVNLYITGIIVKMKGSEVEYVNAGHPDLLHFQSSVKKVRAITDSSHVFKRHPIGISLSQKKYSSITFNVPAGDFLIFYSDGLTESKNYAGENFGITRLSDAIASSQVIDAAGMQEYIIDALNNFAGDIKPGDDITIIIARKI